MSDSQVPKSDMHAQSQKPKRINGKFAKGHSGNPAGCPVTMTMKKTLKMAAMEKVEYWFEWAFLKPHPELTALLKNHEKLSAADLAILSEVDREIVNSMLDRIMGRPAQIKDAPADTGESVESFFRRILQPQQIEESNGEAGQKTES